MVSNFAERARGLVGTRFRPQGRGPDGLDCVGVILATFGIPAAGIRNNYKLGGEDPVELDAALLRHFRRLRPRQLAAGDVMLMTIAQRQIHLGVRTASGFVHAHARLRRVVETPGLPEWPVVAAYRRRLSARNR